ncbi:MAG: glycosyltransferase [Flavobacteriales bacterium]|nr:glycosyltransferase [Flavobacteriales bacterium]
MTTVAVVIPCYNVQAHVEVAVRSVFAQTHADLDIVAVDDGSTDGTRAILQRLVTESSGRLRVISQANAGACAARNAGVAATRGEWIQFLDADDELLPDKIERQIGLAPEGSQLVIGGYRNHYTDGRSTTTVLPLIGDPWEALVRTRMGTTSANLFRRASLLSAGGWDKSLRSSQDYDLLFRMLKKGASPVWDDGICCEVLKRSKGSISRTDERANWLRYLDLRLAMRDHLRVFDPDGQAGNIAIADQHLFMAIRVLSKHDRQAAFDAFDRMLPRGFVPELNRATTRTYLSAFRWLGFRAAERMSNFISGLSK